MAIFTATFVELNTKRPRIDKSIEPKVKSKNQIEQSQASQEQFDPRNGPASVDDLLLKDRALNVAAEGITISDMRLPEQPLIYINEGFERLTGYSAESMLGKNCRFLQGKDTDPATVQEIRDALSTGQECTVEILNYTKKGKQFWNRLSLTPVLDRAGEVTHFIGVQSDITNRKNAEEALLEANRQLEIANLHMKRNLEAAARIQRSLLPDKTQKFDEINFSWRVQQCDELGGDTLNIIPLDKRRFAVYTVDVSGHGVRAALLSTTLSHWFSRVISGPANQAPGAFSFSPVEVAAELNRQFQMDDDNAQYFTMCFGIIDANSREFRYVTAGNPPVIVDRGNGEIEVLKIEGFPIGLLEQAEYSESVIKLNPKDRVFIYTDGVSEAENELEIPFGTEKLGAEITKCRCQNLDNCLTSILESVALWDGNRGLKDDCSILAFELVE